MLNACSSFSYERCNLCIGGLRSTALLESLSADFWIGSICITQALVQASNKNFFTVTKNSKEHCMA
jgi:hypothetical protein